MSDVDFGLFPCPHCGGNDLAQVHASPESGMPYAIDCNECKYTFQPLHKFDVIHAWNTRNIIADGVDQERLYDMAFYTKYSEAKSAGNDYALARLLSGRLREMQKRSVAANKKVTELEEKLKSKLD